MDPIAKISFCLTEDELKIVAEAQRRIAVGGRNSNRSETLRVAIAQLSKMTDQELSDAATGLTRLIPGRKPRPDVSSGDPPMESGQANEADISVQHLVS